jgi:hypothetical protein
MYVCNDPVKGNRISILGSQVVRRGNRVYGSGRVGRAVDG